MVSRHLPMRRQQGSILLVAVIFLVFFTLIAISIFKGSLTSVQSIGNMQWRAETIAAANDAIDRMLSDAGPFQNPTTFTSTVNTTPYTYDANGDGNPDIRVTLPEVMLHGVKRAGPRCMRSVPIPNNALKPINPDGTTNREDANCLGGLSGGATPPVKENPDGTVTPILAGLSLCSNTEWSVTFRADDSVTRTSVDVTQGVGVRIRTTDTGTTCD